MHNTLLSVYPLPPSACAPVRRRRRLNLGAITDHCWTIGWVGGAADVTPQVLDDAYSGGGRAGPIRGPGVHRQRNSGSNSPRIVEGPMTLAWRHIQAPRDEACHSSGCRTAAEVRSAMEGIVVCSSARMLPPREGHRVRVRKEQGTASSTGGEPSGGPRRGAIGQQEPKGARKVGRARRESPVPTERRGIGRRRVGRSAPRNVGACRKGEEMTREGQIGSKGGGGPIGGGRGRTSGSPRRQFSLL